MDSPAPAKPPGTKAAVPTDEDTGGVRVESMIVLSGEALPDLISPRVFEG